MRKLSFVVLFFGVLLGGCRTYPDYSSDFRFPIMRGSITEGQQAFVDLECNQCHVVDGVDLPAFEGTQLYAINLGGDLIYAKTYADLVTSIINPDHILNEQYVDQLPEELRNRANFSPMYLKEEMTVVQMIDIVTFLNSRYRLLPGYTEEFIY
jgi:hypothetical protein